MTDLLKVLEVTRIERRAVVELTNGWLSGFINADGGCEKLIHETKWDVIYSKLV
jgi:hypothetical protein